MINNPIFASNRKYIEDQLTRNDKDGKLLMTCALSQDFFAKTDKGVYQIVGVNSSFIDGKYVEIFVTVDLSETIKHFDGNAVKVFYFNADTIAETKEISEADAKLGHSRPEWRRVQKYIEKQKKQIINKINYEKLPSTPPSAQTGLSAQMYNTQHNAMRQM